MKQIEIELCPRQKESYEFLRSWHSKVSFLHLWAPDGTGRTTVLRKLQKETGAHWIDAKEFVESVSQRHPFAIEEGAAQALRNAIDNFPRIIIDDFHEFFRYAQSSCSGYIRSSFYETVFKVLVGYAESKGTQIVLGTDGNLPDSFSHRCWAHGIGEFQIEDYLTIIKNVTGKAWPNVDFQSLYRFAPNMNCYRILYFCRWLQDEENPTTESCIEFIQSQGMSSNVDTEEVQNVSLDDLVGCDHIRDALEENIILPLENLALAEELGLTPKRGVILAGPPGTGKTTVGRALAHRLKGKFFLIDGTAISGTDYFYHRVDHIFHCAVQNAPSIVFIDDSDVIFESGREHGLYRYLLTKLDGLESKSASNVCVMLTAMDLGNIPPALVRSGRIELWLETRLPEDGSRMQLLMRLLSDKVKLSNPEIMPTIVEKTQGLSGADLKRVVQDAKLKLANDRVKQRPVRPFEDYLLEAVLSLIDAHRSYVAAAKRAYSLNSDRPRWFNVHPELFDSNP